MDNRKVLDEKDLIKTALQEISQMRTKLAAIEQEKTEPIAIVGMACRFPGKAQNTEAFWKLLHDGEESIIEVPSERWASEDYYDPNPEVAGKIYTKYGSFLKGVDLFDARFFGISPKEAEQMDPQQRLLLEVSWEAIEHAGESPEKPHFKQTGVFVGISNNDYAHLLMHSGDHKTIDTYYSTGNSLNVSAGRISFTLGFQGPSVAIDTACSSSLVAVHMACQSIRNGECRQALASGVNLILSPENSIAVSRAQMLAADGRCKTFDAKADGYVRGEGCGVIVLKRLSHALADGNNILAVIKSSAVNQDGRSSGLTVPNGSAQQMLIGQALKNGKIFPSQIDYIEAHGTGTSLGDPIELRALNAELCKERTKANPLLVGSVKTNIGHLEAAAGIAGMIKTILCLQKEEIPPHLNFQNPNPHIHWENTFIKIPTENTAWKKGEKRRLAGVSSFGFSGTNAHIILEEAPIAINSSEQPKELPSHLLCLSAKSKDALYKLIAGYKDYLHDNKQISLSDICYTANTGRKHFIHRASLIASSSEDLINKLGLLMSQPLAEDALFKSGETPRIAFLFTGQGAQYEGACRELYDTHPVFKKTLDYCDELFKPYLKISLIEVLYPKNSGSGLINRTEYTQPVLFAIEYALAALWKSCGIVPNIVSGHSIGEITAACIAGVFSLEDAVKLVAARGRLMQSLPAEGSMLSVFTGKHNLDSILSFYKDHVGVAAINGPEHIVISGKSAQITEIKALMDEQGIKTKPLKVSHAFHSPLMEPILAEFEQIAESIHYSIPSIWFISNLTGDLASDEVTKPKYWTRHIREAVDFCGGMSALEKAQGQILIEIGPKPTLLAMGQNCIKEDGKLWIPSIREGHSDWLTFQKGISDLYENGYSIDWEGYYQAFQGRKQPLPTYPFQRQRYWPTVKPGSPSNTSPKEQFLEELHTVDVDNLIERIVSTGKLSTEQAQFLPYLLEVLKDEHSKQLIKNQENNYLYKVKWIEDYSFKNAPQNEPKKWLIFVDNTGVSKRLADQLHISGNSCTLIHSGQEFLAENENSYTINPASSGHYKKLFSKTHLNDLSQYYGIVHLWSLNKELEQTETDLPFSTFQALGCISALYLMQALADCKGSEALRLAFVSGAAHAVGEEDSTIKFLNRTLWAMAGVIASENPDKNVIRIDLPSIVSGEDISLLSKELTFGKGDQIAIRNNKRFRAILTKADPLPIQTNYTFNADSSYLIAGGLGGLGLKAALWMAEKGAKNLVLLSRKGITSPEIEDKIQSLKSKVLNLLILQVDLSDVNQLQKAFDEINKIAPLKGLIHAAGTLEDGIILQQTEEKFSRVMNAKTVGAWNLHTLTKTLPLDFFICFSSMASVFGSPGQSNYAAANASLDALSQYRRAQGLPAMTINWGPWTVEGMAGKLSHQHKEVMRRMGIEEMDATSCLSILEKLLPDKVSNIGVFNIAWDKFQNNFPDNRIPELFSEFIDTSVINNNSGIADNAKDELLSKLRDSDEGEQHKILSDFLQITIGKIMGLDPLLVDKNYPLIQMGLDSLMAVKVKHAIKQNLGIETNLIRFMEGISGDQLAKELQLQINHNFSKDENNTEVSLPGSLSPEMAESLLHKVDQYSEEDIDTLLAKLLSEKE